MRDISERVQEILQEEEEVDVWLIGWQWLLLRDCLRFVRLCCDGVSLGTGCKLDVGRGEESLLN